MRWPNSLSSDLLLADYWQRQPLFLPGAIDADLPALEADELAWLATLPDVESRLVFTEHNDRKARYRVEHGPFTESDLNALPAEDWTLLVQDVDKHLPDFRAYFGQIPFIPTWRIDDLMVSVAAPGGSVGPHKDNYDVFLCQGTGTRRWRVSRDRSVAADPTTTSLSLLLPFEPTEECICNSGDMLYVPPGIPHWGVAQDICITYSIGMRAPTRAELSAGYARVYETGLDTSIDNESAGSCDFYTDTDLQAHEAPDGKIAVATIHRLRDQGLLDASLSDEQLMMIFGSVVTDPKAWLDPDRASAKDVQAVLEGRKALQVHGMALTAWCDCPDLRLVFVNGSANRVPTQATALVQALCVERKVQPATVLAVMGDPEGAEFVHWLLDQGVLDID